MKRALAMGLGLLMTAGAASQASAASQIDFSGYYRIYQMNDTNLGRQAGDASFTDSYWVSRLQFDLTFKPTDELEISWRLRAPNNRRWGAGNDNRSGMSVGTYHVYGLVKQDWGNVYIGRLDEDLDVYGLASLGYQPGTNPIFTNTGPFEDAAVFDGVRYTREWDNGFGFMAQYVKMDNNGSESVGPGFIGQGAPQNFASDQDWDRVHLEALYKWDGGGASLGAMYDRDAADGNGFTGNPSWTWRENRKTQAWYLNPAIMHSWGDFSVHFEGMAGWGKEYEVDQNIRDIKGSGYAAYLDFDYNYGPGNVTLGAWYTSGTGMDELYNTGDPKSKSMVGMGGNFYPLIVAYNDNASGWGRVGTGDQAQAWGVESNSNALSVANNAFDNFVADAYLGFVPTFLNTGADITNTGMPVGSVFEGFGRQRIISLNEGTEANHWALALSGNHAFTDTVSMHYALAYLALNKPNYRVVDSWNGLMNDGSMIDGGAIGYKDQDKDLGFEVDLGFSFQLLDNLEFTTAFGYMFTGDAYKTLRGYNEVATTLGDTAGQAVWADGKDTYSWYNTLTFSF